MRKILIILFLLPLLVHAQMIGNAYYNGITQTKIGVLPASTTMTAAQKGVQVYDSLQTGFIRTNVVTSQWTGTYAALDAYVAKGLKLLLNVSYYSTGSINPFLKPAQVQGYKDTLLLIAQKYHPIAVFVGNEEFTLSYHSGNLDEYGLNELKPTWEVCHPLGILVCDGGLAGGGTYAATFRYVDTTYGRTEALKFAYNGQTSANSQQLLTTGQINEAITPGANPATQTALKKLDSVFNYNQYVDVWQIHLYLPEDGNGTNTRTDTVTQLSYNCIRYEKEWIQKRTGKLVGNNEFGNGNYNGQPALTLALLKEFIRCGYWDAGYWSGLGAANHTTSLFDLTTGVLTTTGIAWRDFNLSQKQSTGAMPIQHTSHWKLAGGIGSGVYQSGNGSWVAGDTIVFRPTISGGSVRTYFTLQGVNGTAAAHITLYADSGQVEMYNGFSFTDCSYIDIDGDHSGSPDGYGFHIHSPSSYSGDPINVDGMSSHQNFHGIWMHHTNDGIRIKNDLACDSSSKWPFRFTGYQIYNMKIDDMTNEGMYLGNTDPYDQSRTVNCSGVDVHYRVSGLDSFSVHDISFDSVHRQCINFSGGDGPDSNYFYNLTAYNTGNGVETNQGAVLFFGSASRNCFVHDNHFNKSFNDGIHSYAESISAFYNNYIDSSGYCSVGGVNYTLGGIYNLELNNFTNFTYLGTFHVYNNTFLHSTGGSNILLYNNGNKYTTTGNCITNSGTINNADSFTHFSTITCP